MARAFALGVGITAVAARDGAHDEQPQAAALHLRRARRQRAIEALEHSLQLAPRDANTIILHPNFHVLQIRRD